MIFRLDLLMILESELYVIPQRRRRQGVEPVVSSPIGLTQAQNLRFPATTPNLVVRNLPNSTRIIRTPPTRNARAQVRNLPTNDSQTIIIGSGKQIK